MRMLKWGAAALAIVAALATAPVDAKTFKWAAGNDPGALDPYSRNVTTTLMFLANMYEQLVRHDRELNLQPALATKWEQSAPDVWRFTLRQGVKFHEGEPFTADDVVFSYERARGPGSLLANNFASVKELRKVDQFTVEFVTNGPDATFPSLMTNIMIMSKAWAEKHNITRTTDISKQEESYASSNVNGTGPFKLRSRSSDGRVEMVANPDWWDRPEHNLTEVLFTPLANPSTRTAALIAGDVDMVYGLPINSIERVQQTPGLKVHQKADLRTMFFGLDVISNELRDSDVKGRNPFKDKRVRQAVQMALNTDAIHRNVMRGASVPNYLMVGPGVNGFDPSLNVPYKFDPDGARRLLAEAGYPNGFEMSMDCSNDRYVNDEQVCTAVASMLARAGIRARLRLMPFQQFVRFVNPPYDTNFFFVGWLPPTYDAHNSLLSLTATRQPGGISGNVNVGGFSNPRNDELIRMIGTETDVAKRNAMIKESLTIVRDEMAYIPIHQQVLLYGAKQNVSLVQLPSDWFMLRYVRVD